MKARAKMFFVERDRKKKLLMRRKRREINNDPATNLLEDLMDVLFWSAVSIITLPIVVLVAIMMYEILKRAAP